MLLSSLSPCLCSIDEINRKNSDLVYYSGNALKQRAFHFEKDYLYVQVHHVKGSHYELTICTSYNEEVDVLYSLENKKYNDLLKAFKEEISRNHSLVDWFDSLLNPIEEEEPSDEEFVQHTKYSYSKKGGELTHKTGYKVTVYHHIQGDYLWFYDDKEGVLTFDFENITKKDVNKIKCTKEQALVLLQNDFRGLYLEYIRIQEIKKDIKQIEQTMRNAGLEYDDYDLSLYENDCLIKAGCTFESVNWLNDYSQIRVVFTLKGEYQDCLDLYDFKSKIATIKHNIEQGSQDYELIRDIKTSSYSYVCIQKESRVDNFSLDMIWKLEGDYLAVHFKSENLTLTFEQVRELIYTPLYIQILERSKYGDCELYQGYVTLEELNQFIEEYELKPVSKTRYYSFKNNKAVDLILNRELTESEKRDV